MHNFTPLDVYIRWLIRRDMPEVLSIEARSFADYWSEDDFLRVLRERNCIGMAAECQGRVVGYMAYELHATRLHLLNLAVDPACRRRGVGTQMAAKLKGKLGYGRTALTLAVADCNLAAQQFWRALGFRATAVLPGHYDDGGDAYAMRYGVEAAALT